MIINEYHIKQGVHEYESVIYYIQSKSESSSYHIVFFSRKRTEQFDSIQPPGIRNYFFSTTLALEKLIKSIKFGQIYTWQKLSKLSGDIQV